MCLGFDERDVELGGAEEHLINIILETPVTDLLTSYYT